MRSTGKALLEVNCICAEHTAQGVLLAAAVLRHAAKHCQLQFGFEPERWKRRRALVVIELSPEIVGKFEGVLRGHKIIGILSDQAGWQEILKKSMPVLPPVEGMSGAFQLFRHFMDRATLEFLGSSRGRKLSIDEQTIELCLMASLSVVGGQRGAWIPAEYPQLINQALENDNKDCRRAKYMARHFAKYRRPDSKIRNWAL